MLPARFRTFWLGETVSLVGSATTATLIPLVAASELRAGPLAMGLLTAATWLPWLLLGLPAGAVLDQLPPRPVMIAADLVAAGAAAAVPALWALHALTVPALVTVAFLLGCSAVVFRAALPRLVTRVVDSTQLGRANSRLYATESASTIAGPGIAGALAAIAAAAAGVLLDAVSFLVSAACLASLRLDRPARRPRPDPLLRRIRDGLAVVVQDPILRYYPLLGAAANFGLTGLTALQVLYLVDDLRAGHLVLGLVLACAGVGGALGALLGPYAAGRLGSARADVRLQLISAGILLVPLATPGLGVAWMAAGLLVSGAAIAGSNVIRATWRQTYVPDHLLARVGTLSLVLGFGTMPIAALVAGWLGGLVGVRVAIAVMLGVHVAAVLTMPFSPVAGRRDLPTRSGSSSRDGDGRVPDADVAVARSAA
jgi:MFS family permease